MNFCKITEKFDLKGVLAKGCKCRRKLDILIYGEKIQDFKVSAQNKFEWLKGDLNGFASIRIDDQWRIILKINEINQLEDVELIDYHK